MRRVRVVARVVAHPCRTGQALMRASHESRLFRTTVCVRSPLCLLRYTPHFSLFLFHRLHLRFHDAQTKYIFYEHTGDYRQNRRERVVGFPFKVYFNNSPKVIEWILLFIYYLSKILKMESLVYFSKTCTRDRVVRQTATIDINRQDRASSEIESQKSDWTLIIGKSRKND